MECFLPRQKLSAFWGVLKAPPPAMVLTMILTANRILSDLKLFPACIEIRGNCRKRTRKAFRRQSLPYFAILCSIFKFHKNHWQKFRHYKKTA